MKRYILIFLLLFSFGINAQNISGQAFYESKTTVDMDAFGGGREMSEEMKKTVATMMKSALEKTYVITFNKDESIYTEQEKLDAAMINPGFKMMMSSYTPGTQYKNIKTGQIVEENEFFGKQFLVTDSIKTLDWQITKESKTIGQYIAFKATAIKKVDPNDYSMARPKKKEEKENAEVKNDSNTIQDTIE